MSSKKYIEIVKIIKSNSESARAFLSSCLTGHGDFLPWTPEQMRFLRELVNALREKYNIWIENVIGHREVNDLIAAGKLSARYRTDKTCPGKKIDMNALRLYILQGHQQHIFRLPGV